MKKIVMGLSIFFIIGCKSDWCDAPKPKTEIVTVEVIKEVIVPEYIEKEVIKEVIVEVGTKVEIVDVLIKQCWGASSKTCIINVRVFFEYTNKTLAKIKLDLDGNLLYNGGPSCGSKCNSPNTLIFQYTGEGGFYAGEVRTLEFQVIGYLEDITNINNYIVEAL